MAKLLDVDPQGDLTKMMGQRKPRDLPLTLASAMNDVVAGIEQADYPEIMHHREGVDFLPGNCGLSAMEARLVTVTRNGLAAIYGQYEAEL